jgi:hypothetical protein
MTMQLVRTYPVGPPELWRLRTTGGASPGWAPDGFRVDVRELESVADGAQVVMTIDRLHDEEWTQRRVARRSNELDNLAAAVAS